MVSTRKDASVIVKSKFVLPNNETFQKYIDYVDRDEAKRNEAYDKYSSYSESYGEAQFHKQQKIIRDQRHNIKRLQEKIKEENTKLNNMNLKLNNYEKYKDSLDEFDSLKELFSKDSEVFNWKEKRNLRINYQNLSPDFNDFSTEDKAVELYSSYVEKILDGKKEKLNQTKINKEKYIEKLEKKLNYSINKVENMEDRLKNYDKYMDYMGNPEKTSSLFTESSNQLNENEKNELKGKFKIAHSKGSIMWQDVISFDNRWLEENGLYDAKSHTVDENRLKDIVRLSMKEMLKKESMDKHVIWSGAIHYNTDNIHVHIATVEPSPTRERGKRKLKSLESMKSKVVNNIMDRSQAQKKINDLIRNRMVNSKKSDSTLSFKNRKFKKDFLEIFHALPEDRRQWSYGYNSLSSIKPKIDKMSRDYIEKYHKKDFENLIEKLDKEVEVYKKTYGSSDKKRYENYKDNKVDELYKRMGNAFLQEMKQYDNSVKAKLVQEKVNGNSRNRKEVFKDNLGFNQIKYGIDRMLNSEYKNWKNQLAYEKLQQDIDMER
ncbi:relaxase MobL [Peribacillus frigoritolerans]|uniref:MobP2 family relaxase n=1 Tax=Peribacillus frigoritolerans TaxID=450367 RepID=UPI00203E09D8|nr:MobP2 family relaxase [Peribacillus frigoritolerans]MCM3169471.1 relaxase MobL [Peribacillus frigoritolerans]